MIPALALLFLQAAAPQAAKPPIIIPPKAAPVTGAIEEVILSPLVAEPFSCVEHPLGQLDWAGDALGTDCTVIGGLTKEGGFAREFRTDGKTNEDWYGWHATLLAPFDGVVVGAFAKNEVNTPGTFGKPPAAMLQFRRADGVIVVYAHVTDVTVKIGDTVTAGQPVAKVGNNGYARAPHTHVGAWRERDNMPLQIRWDLRAMGKLQVQ
jgi:hypothetical protein